MKKKNKEKKDKKNNKLFIRLVAIMLCVIIVCFATNKAFDAISSSVTKAPVPDNGQQTPVDTGNETPSQVYIIGTDGSQTPADNVQQPANSDGNNAGTPSGGGTAAANPSNGGGTAAAPSNDPTSYNKTQLIQYYNQCLRKTYSQPKFTVTKTEIVDVKLGEMTLNGEHKPGMESAANKIVEKNKKNKTTTKNFTSQTAVVDAKERYILPANLYPAAVKSYNVSKSGSGYVINFTLNQESCDFRRKPPYNSSCTFPLDFTEIDLGSLGEITSAQFFYPGTTLTATIDGQGRVIKTYVVMPLTVDDATGTAVGNTKLSVDISGHWYCTNVMSF